MRQSRYLLWPVVAFLLFSTSSATMATDPPPPPANAKQKPATPPPPPANAKQKPDTPPPPPANAKQKPANPPPPQEQSRVVSLKNGMTPSGLTVSEIEALIGQRYDLDEIMQADAIAARHGVRVADLLAERSAGKEWGQIVADVMKSHPASPASNVPEGDMIKVVAAHTGLTAEQVAALLAQGHSLNDIGNALTYAKRYDQTISQVLSRKGNGDWESVARRLSANASATDRDSVMKATGLSEQEVDGLLKQGHDLADVRQAVALAKAAKKTVAEVLAFRNGRDWLTVANELLPATNAPRYTMKPSGNGGN